VHGCPAGVHLVKDASKGTVARHRSQVAGSRWRVAATDGYPTVLHSLGFSSGRSPEQRHLLGHEQLPPDPCPDPRTVAAADGLARHRGRPAPGRPPPPGCRGRGDTPGRTRPNRPTPQLANRRPDHRRPRPSRPLIPNPTPTPPRRPPSRQTPHPPTANPLPPHANAPAPRISGHLRHVPNRTLARSNPPATPTSDHPGPLPTHSVAYASGPAFGHPRPLPTHSVAHAGDPALLTSCHLRYLPTHAPIHLTN
jgi:hypothetical protein